MSRPDPATGLPQLPDGQWWEVRKTPPRAVSEWGWPGNWQPFEAAIRTSWTTVTDEQPGRWWWSKPAPATTETKVIDLDVVVIEGYDLTPRAIRQAAYALVQHRNRQARTDALLGAYPPKALVKK